jgi:dihydroneopterin aldolase
VPPARGTDRPFPTIAGVIRVDRVALRGLKARGYHGVFPREREEGQTFIVDLVLGQTCLKHEEVQEVEVCVHKPDAPITVPFDDVTVTITRSRV